MASLSPTQRTLRHLKEKGRICGIVEKWNQYAGPCGRRQDLFGFIDIIALDPEKGIVAIQSCGQAFSEHYKKIVDTECTENVIAWLNSGGKIELWGWRKLKLKKGGKAERWFPRIQEITMQDIMPKFAPKQGHTGVKTTKEI